MDGSGILTAVFVFPRKVIGPGGMVECPITIFDSYSNLFELNKYY